MDITPGINNKILQKETQAIRSLFILNDKYAHHNLSNTNFKQLIHPFDKLLQFQFQLNNDPNIVICEKFVFLYKELCKEDWIHPIFEEILFSVFLIGRKDPIHVSQIFQSLFREFSDFSTVNRAFKDKYVHKIINYLLYFYYSMKNIKMYKNLFSVLQAREALCRKDKVIFSFYKGLYLLSIKDYKKAHDIFGTCFTVKNAFLKHKVAPYYILTGLAVLKYPTKSTLDKYGMMDYYEIIKCLMVGNQKHFLACSIKLYDQIFELDLVEYFHVYLYNLVFLNFLTNIQDYLYEQQKLTIANIKRCLDFIGNEMDHDEIIFKICNLFKMKMRGECKYFYDEGLVIMENINK